MLVVVEDRDVDPLPQLLLDAKALGRLDVLEVDASERRLEEFDDPDDLVRVFRRDLEVEDIDVGESLEQDSLPLHDRLARQRTDVAKAEHGGTVRDDRNQVRPRRVLACKRRVAHDLQTGVRHTGRVGQTQVDLRVRRLGGGNGDLARAGKTMVVKG